MPPSDLKTLVFEKGESIFREGDPGNAAYIVQSGAVGIFKSLEGEEVRLATLTGGELFGEMAIIDGSRRMAAAVAIERTVLRKIPADLIEDKLDQYDSFLKALIKILVSNLRNVHKMYMRRPRSVQDYLNALAFHADGLRTSLWSRVERDRIPQDRALARLDAVDAEIRELRHLFETVSDRRKDALGESDFEDSQGAPAALTGQSGEGK